MKRADLARNSVVGAKVLDGSLGVADFAPNQLPAGEQGPQGPVGPTEGVGADPVGETALVREGSFDESQFSTTREGRLFVTKHVPNLTLTCSAGFARVWLEVDGVRAIGTVLSSFPSGAPGRQADLSGVTASPVAAGTHTARVSAECTTGDLTGATVSPTSGVSAIVLGG